MVVVGSGGSGGGSGCIIGAGGSGSEYHVERRLDLLPRERRAVGQEAHDIQSRSYNRLMSLSLSLDSPGE